MIRPLVSVLLVTRDGMAHLPAVLDRIEQQETALATEVVAVDSGSTDGTARLLRSRVDRFAHVDPETFNHGSTRNYGVSLCRGAFVVLLVQDAVPASRRWLTELVTPLLEDERVAGTFARQLPRPGASAVTRHHLARWAAAAERPRRSRLAGAADLQRMSPSRRHAACTFDNVCSCIRRAVWEQHPFAAVPIAEDLAWAKEVLLAGHHLLYVPRAAVIHSHDRTLRYELERTYLVHRQLRHLFGLQTIVTPPQLLLAVAAGLVSHARCVAGGPRGAEPALLELGRALGLAVVWPVGQFLGGWVERGWPSGGRT